MKRLISLFFFLALASFAAHAEMCPTEWDVREGEFGLLPENGAFFFPPQPTVITNDPAQTISFFSVTTSFIDPVNPAAAGMFQIISCAYLVTTPIPGAQVVPFMQFAFITAFDFEDDVSTVRRSSNKVANHPNWIGGGNPPTFSCGGVAVDECDF